MRISFIGSGNVATHLAAAVRNAGHKVVDVCGRNAHNAALLAYHVGARAVSAIPELDPGIDLLILAVSDDALPDVAEAIDSPGFTVAHTSGSVPLWVLEKFDKHGVLYPLQTFSKTVEVNMREVPLCLEAGSADAYFTIENLAKDISNNVQRISSAQRKVLHLSAVFACNFVNHLYSISQKLLVQNELGFNMLRPLIMQTAQKVMQACPADVQTGPAVRDDRNTMRNHLQMLADDEQLSELYQLMSDAIFRAHNRPAGE